MRCAALRRGAVPSAFQFPVEPLGAPRRSLIPLACRRNMPSRKHHDVRGNPAGPLSDAESLGILDSNTRCPRMQGNHRKADPNALS